LGSILKKGESLPQITPKWKDLSQKVEEFLAKWKKIPEKG
jgi:hypothetical protein